VTLVAISKGVPIARLAEAVAIGLTELGENRVQEAEPKVRALANTRWHMVGRLQSNKAARALELFAEIQSVDSLALAERLSRLVVDGRRPPTLPAPVPVWLQVNVDADPAKAGFSPASLEEALDDLAALPGLRLRGLMTVGRLARDAAGSRTTFTALRELSERLSRAQPALGDGLSMGMSDDFEVAVEEGATVVRLGRALFGERPTV
jgi:PLP dependent protein